MISTTNHRAVAFSSLPDAARLWIFAAAHPVGEDGAAELLARVDGFEPPDLEKALYEDRTLGRVLGRDCIVVGIGSLSRITRSFEARRVLRPISRGLNGGSL